MAITISEQCKCGAAFSTSSRNATIALALHDVFTLRHGDCITPQSDDAPEEPGGDVFTQAERAPQHSEPELTTGFQRVVW